jgi:hypothetical protein
MPVFSPNPKRRAGALVVLVVLMIVFYFVYDYVTRSYSTNPALLFLLFGFSVVLLLSPLVFETKRPVAQGPFTPPPVGTSEKPARPILRNCPKCKILLPGSVLKCPNCGSTFPEVLGLDKDPAKLKSFDL